MKLKKEVKEGLVCIGLLFIAIIIVAILAHTGEKTYNECLIENNNDTEFCFELIK